MPPKPGPKPGPRPPGARPPGGKPPPGGKRPGKAKPGRGKGKPKPAGRFGGDAYAGSYAELSIVRNGNQLSVTPLRGQIISKEKKPDCYVECALLGKGKPTRKQKTKTAKNTTTPTWNETLTFTLKGDETGLEVKVMDDDFGKDDLMFKEVLNFGSDIREGTQQVMIPKGITPTSGWGSSSQHRVPLDYYNQPRYGAFAKPFGTGRLLGYTSPLNERPTSPSYGGFGQSTHTGGGFGGYQGATTGRYGSPTFGQSSGFGGSRYSSPPPTGGYGYYNNQSWFGSPVGQQQW